MSEMRTDRSSPGDSNGNALDGSPPRADGPVRRPLVMAVVNVTPDSFSDGGRWFDAAAAVEHGLQLVAQGADILDGRPRRQARRRPRLRVREDGRAELGTARAHG